MNNFKITSLALSTLIFIPFAVGMEQAPPPKANEEWRAENELMKAARSGDHQKIKLLIETGADIHATNTEGETALILACFGRPDTIKLLLAAGANVNATDHNNYTALMQASVFGKVENVKLLLAAGAAVNAKTKHGETAVSLAHSNFKTNPAWGPRYKQIIELLEKTEK